MIRPKTRALIIVLLAVVGVAWADETPLPPRPALPLQVGTLTIRAEVVSTAEDRARGLMYRKSLAADAGMLFIYSADDSSRVCMWMRNTLVPLSVAFLDRNGKVLNIADMQPRSETAHCATGAARYVLEVNRGTFGAAGVKPGTRIGGLPAVH